MYFKRLNIKAHIYLKKYNIFFKERKCLSSMSVFFVIALIQITKIGLADFLYHHNIF